MAMTIKTEGISELNLMLAKLGSRAQDVASGALYDGAGVVADAFTRATESIQTEKFDYAPPGKTRLPSPEEKDALKRKTGIARFRKNGGEVDTMVGIGSGSGGNYAEAKGYAVIHEYIDRALSASKDTEKRLDFQKMIRDSSKRQFDMVLVWKQDRFARSRYESLINKRILEENGVKVVPAFVTPEEKESAEENFSRVQQERDSAQARVTELEAQVAELSAKPKGQPAHLEHNGAPTQTGNKGLDRLTALMGAK